MINKFKNINYSDQERFKRVVLSNPITYTFKKNNLTFKFYSRIERINFKEKSVFYVVVFENEILINNIKDAKRTINQNKFKNWLKNLKLNGFKEVKK